MKIYRLNTGVFTHIQDHSQYKYLGLQNKMAILNNDKSVHIKNLVHKQLPSLGYLVIFPSQVCSSDASLGDQMSRGWEAQKMWGVLTVASWTQCCQDEEGSVQTLRLERMEHTALN